MPLTRPMPPPCSPARMAHCLPFQRICVFFVGTLRATGRLSFPTSRFPPPAPIHAGCGECAAPAGRKWYKCAAASARHERANRRAVPDRGDVRADAGVRGFPADEQRNDRAVGAPFRRARRKPRCTPPFQAISRHTAPMRFRWRTGSSFLLSDAPIRFLMPLADGQLLACVNPPISSIDESCFALLDADSGESSRLAPCPPTRNTQASRWTALPSISPTARRFTAPRRPMMLWNPSAICRRWTRAPVCPR